MPLALQTTFRAMELFRWLCVTILLASLWPAVAWAQKRQSESDVVIREVTVTKRITVSPNEGYLTLFTTPQASITLIPVKSAGQAPKSPKSRDADEQGIGVFDQLTPGDYKLTVTRDEYHELRTTINIAKGRAKAYSASLKPKYGTIVLAMDDQAAPDVTVWLDDKQINDPERLAIREGKIYIRRVPVSDDKQEIKPRSGAIRGQVRDAPAVSAVEIRVSKPNHEDRTIQRVIQPGECDNVIALKLNRLAITLTVKSEPAAEVYVDKVRQGRILPDRTLVISDLLPGPHTLRIECEGFEPVELPLTLDLKRREVTQDVPLTPLVEDGEFSEDFSSTVKQWSVYWPSGWKPQTAPLRGVLVTSDDLSLAYNTSKPNRRFNIYSDFTLTMSLTPSNGKGVSWVVRAKDERNYYLFELTTPLSSIQAKAINFYVVREGKIVRKESHPLLAKIENPGVPIRFQMEAKGDRLSFRILGQGDRGNGPTIGDATFRRGGIGIRTVNGLEMFVSEVFIQPLK